MTINPSSLTVARQQKCLLQEVGLGQEWLFWHGVLEKQSISVQSHLSMSMGMLKVENGGSGWMMIKQQVQKDQDQGNLFSSSNFDHSPHLSTEVNCYTTHIFRQ